MIYCNNYIVRDGGKYTTVTVNEKGIITNSSNKNLIRLIGKNIEEYPMRIPVIENYKIYNKD